MIVQSYEQVFPIIYRALLFEINVCLLGLIISVLTYRRYKQNSQASLKYLFHVFRCAVSAIFFSLIVKLFYMYYEVAFFPRELMDTWFFSRLLSFRFSFICIAASAHFVLLFSREVMVLSNTIISENTRIRIDRIYLVISIIVYLVLWEYENYIFDAICFLMLALHSLVVNIPIAVRFLKISRQQRENPHLRSLRYIGFMSVSFMLIILFLLIDRLLIVFGSYGYTIHFYLAWASALAGIISAYYGFIRDVTVKLYRIAIKNLPIPMMIFDKNYKITDWNDAASEIFGWEKLEVLNANVVDFIVSEEQRNDVQGLIEGMAQADIQAPFFHQAITKEGKEILCKWNNRPLLNDSGELMGHLSIVRDITEEQRLKDQIAKNQRLEAVGKLSSGVAHDFNNILSIILGYSRLSQNLIEESDPIHDHLIEIEKAGLRAESIVKQLLAFSRKQVTTPRILNMNDIIKELYSSLLQLIYEDIDIRLFLASDLPKIKADKHQVEQVLINLLVNAQDAIMERAENAEKPIKKQITIRTKHSVGPNSKDNPSETDENATYIELIVEDTGIGMDRETMHRIFEPFFTTKGVGKGTGLGLPTVHGIVSQANGFINVESRPMEGATFYIYWPTTEDVTESNEKSETPHLYKPNNLRVLLVEDDLPLKELISERLRELDLDVITASCGQEALDIPDDQLERIDLVITDFVMPNMNGKELIDRLAAKDLKFSVIYISGYPAGMTEKIGINDEDVFFINKPFKVSELTRILAIIDDQQEEKVRNDTL